MATKRLITADEIEGLQWFKNYILKSGAEPNTLGWEKYNDGVTAVPIDGIGGAPLNLSFTSSTIAPLRNNRSFEFAKGAANRQGEGVSYPFTIDDADKAKPLTISFEYEIESGTYVDDDVRVYIYDVTNLLLIEPAGRSILKVGIESKHVATFQTSSNSTSYRLIFHVASTSALPYVLRIDSITVGPQVVVNGAVASDWASFTPVASPSTNINLNLGWWRRVGDSMEMRVTLRWSGAGGAGLFAVALPSGYSIDSSDVDTSNSLHSHFGHWQWYDDSGSAASRDGKIERETSTTIIFRRSDTSGAIDGSVFAANDRFTFIAFIPITGWSSNVQLSTDTDTRVVAASWSENVSTSINSTGVTVPFNVKNYDTHGAFETGTSEYIVKVPGIYRISVALAQNSASWTFNQQLRILIYKNGSPDLTIAQFLAGSTNTFNMAATGSGSIQANAGDKLKIVAFSDVTATLNSIATRNFFTIERLSGPSVIAASETVNARAGRSVVQSIPNGTFEPIVFNSKQIDSHGGMNTSTGVYTVNVSGKFFVSAQVGFAGSTSGATRALEIRKNGTRTSFFGFRPGTFSSSAAYVNGSDLLSCVAGDTIDVTAFQDTGSPLNTTSSIEETNVTIYKIGN